jgi:uncharacterized protein
MENKYADHLNKLVEITESIVKKRFMEGEGSHDWFHIDRVRKLALMLAQKEGGDLFVIEMAALLHDLDDWKLTGTNDAENVAQWLGSLDLNEHIQKQIMTIIQEVSFKGAGVATPCLTTESKIVQDADRLDAMGAIGIARAFAYGGWKGQPLHLPGIRHTYYTDLNDYQNHKGTTINHFYEKLLLLRDRINTPSASVIANDRHQFMLTFLKHFFSEWEQEI